MVAGGFDESANHAEALEILGTLLGDQLIRQEHDILTGGQTDLDRVVAKAAAKAAEELGFLAVDRVTNYVLQGQDLKYEYGRILRSQLENWDRIGKQLRFPEPVYNADVIILLGGWEGTYRAANWARIADKPQVPIAGFGLAAEQIFQEELTRFGERYADLIEKKGDRIIPSIIEGIRKSAFIIADVTDAKPNVYYELGLAHGATKPVILTAKIGTPRPFDIFDLPIVYWSDLDGLATELEERVNDIAKAFGR